MEAVVDHGFEGDRFIKQAPRDELYRFRHVVGLPRLLQVALHGLVRNGKLLRDRYFGQATRRQGGAFYLPWCQARSSAVELGRRGVTGKAIGGITRE